MSLTKYRYYFGPAGDVRILPSVIRDAGVEPTPELSGALTRSINGTPTRIVYGAKRTWNLIWPIMSELEARPLNRIEAAYRNHITRQFYFLDTKNTNYLSPDVAVCAAEGSPKNSFTWTGGIVSRSFVGTFHAELDGFADGALTFIGAAIGQRLMSRPMSAIVPGSDYLFSGIFSGSGSITLSFLFYDSAGVFISATSGGVIALSGVATVQSMSLLGSSTPGNAATFRVGITASTASPVVNTQGWMLQYDEASRPAAGWYPGRGGCEVVVGQYAVRYTTYKTRAISASLMEVA